MTALYQLTSSYRALLAVLADGDHDATTIADTLEASGIIDDLQVKAQNYEYVARSLEADKPAMLAEIERLQARIASRDKSAQSLRTYLYGQMVGAGLDKIEAPFFKFSIRKNPPSVEVLDPLSLSAEYWFTPEPKPPVAAPDKAAIKLALQSGVEVTGARLTQGTRLVVT